MNRADVGVGELGRRLGLPVESAPKHRVLRQALGEELERDQAARAPLARPVDAPHPAAAEPVEHLVAVARAGPAADPRAVERRGHHPLQPSGRVRPLGAREERLHLAAELEIPRDGHLEEPASLAGRKVGALVEEDLDPLPAGGVHGTRGHRTAPRCRRIASTSFTGSASTVLPFARSVVAAKSEL